MKKIIIISMALMLSLFVITGCGNNNDGNGNNQTSDTTENTGNAAGDIMDDAGNAVNDAADGAGDIANDAADSAGDIVNDAAGAVDDMTGDASDKATGNYQTYDDAYNYFMNMLPAGSKKYEVKNSDKDLAEYDTGKQGYHFELHDTEKTDETKLGDFYVDADTGKVYLKSSTDGSVSEYDMSTLK